MTVWNLAAEPYPFVIFLFIFPWQTTGLRMSPYQKFVELLPRIAFHIYLLIIINIITKPAHFRSPSCLRDFWQIKSDNSNRKTRVRFVYVLQQIWHGDFFLWNKIFSQPTVKYFIYINQKCYFILWLFQLRWTLIQHIQVFHVNKPNTCFALRVIPQKSCDLKARIPQRQDGVT